MEPSTIAAFTNPEILIGTFGYLLLKPALKNSGLVDTKKGAYKMSMIIYNVLMDVFSAACFVATTTALGAKSRPPKKSVNMVAAASRP